MTTRHPQADILEAIAAGKQCQHRYRRHERQEFSDWSDEDPTIILHVMSAGASRSEVRIKPEPKPDVVLYTRFSFDNKNPRNGPDDCGLNIYLTRCLGVFDSLKLTFSGETGKLISAEVIE